MAFRLTATCHTTHSFHAEIEPNLSTVCFNAALSQEEAAAILNPEIGASFPLPTEILRGIEKIKKSKPKPSFGEAYKTGVHYGGLYGRVDADQIAYLSLYDDSTKERLAIFYVEGMLCEGEKMANHWRPLIPEDAENITVADLMRNAGKGMFVLFRGDKEPQNILLRPEDHLVRLIGDHFCLIDPSSAPRLSSRKELPAPLRMSLS